MAYDILPLPFPHNEAVLELEALPSSNRVKMPFKKASLSLGTALEQKGRKTNWINSYYQILKFNLIISIKKFLF